MNVPPRSPVMVAKPPSQVGVMVNVANSSANTVTSTVEIVGQLPTVSYEME